MSELFSNRLDRSIVSSSLITIFTVSVLYALFQIINGQLPDAIIANLIIAGVTAIVYVLFIKGYYFLTYWFFAAITPAIITFNTFYFGNMNMQLYIISAGVMTTFLSRNKKYWTELSWIIVVLAFISNYLILTYQGKFDKLEEVEKMPFYLNTLFPLFIIYLVTTFYKRINDSHRLKLQENDEYKGRLISILSHDFRSPLSNIKGLLNLYTTGLIAQDTLHLHLIELEKDLDKTILSLDNTLHWIKNQLKNTSPKVSRIDIYQMTNSVISELEGEIKRKGIDVESSTKEGFIPYIESDENMLIIILRNVLSNAIKFCPNESGKINVHFFNESKDMIGLSIADNGVGMEKSRVEALFSEETESTFGTKGERGFGLGLSLVKTFSNILNINVEVESQVNQGTTFTFHIARNISNPESKLSKREHFDNLRVDHI